MTIITEIIDAPDTRISGTPPPPTPAAPPALWTLGAPPDVPGVGSQGLLHITTTQQGGAYKAAAEFQRIAASVIEPSDPSPGLAEQVRKATAGSIHLAAVRAVNEKITATTAVIASYDARTAELSRRRDNPDLLQQEDLGRQLHEIDLATAVLTAKRREAQLQLGQMTAKLRRHGFNLLIESKRAAEQAENVRTRALAVEYQRLQNELVSVSSPIIEGLFHTLLALCHPNLEAVCAGLMHEFGAGAAVPPEPPAKIPDFTPRRQPQLLHPRPQREAEPESDDSPEMAMDLAGVDHGD